MADDIVIASEADAFTLIENLEAGNIEPEGFSGLKFDDWPHLDIRLKGPQYHQTITPPVMKALLEYQQSVYRAYALFRYNTPSTKHLTREEREALEMRVRVGDGSSWFHIDLSQLMEQLGAKLVDRMDPTHLVITILGIAVLLAGRSVYLAYLQERKETRSRELEKTEREEFLSTMKFMSEQESKRMDALERIVSESPRLESVQDVAHDANTSLTKAAADAEVADVQGVSLAGDIAKELIKNARRRSDEVRLDGPYMIRKVDATKVQRFEVTIASMESESQFTATVQQSDLTETMKRVLRQAEWDRQPILLHVNAKVIEGEVRSAVILAAKTMESAAGV